MKAPPAPFDPDADKSLRPLSVLRDRAQAERERKLFALSGELPLD